MDRSPPPPPRKPITLLQPPPKHKGKHKIKVFGAFRSAVRSFPIITPAFKMPVLPGLPNVGRSHSSKTTGTIFGHRKGRVSLSIQPNPKTLPSIVIDLGLQTSAFQKELGNGMVRIAMETEKRSEKDGIRLMEEPSWVVYFNGKKTGYGVRRDATEEDLNVMEVLRPVSMGTGALPANQNGADADDPDDEMTYMRACFERVVGSKDSETFYMLNPEGSNVPELSIFFLRV